MAFGSVLVVLIAIYLVAAGKWLPVLIYFVFGIAWILYDLNRPLRPTQLPAYGRSLGSLLMTLILWPLRCTIMIGETRAALSDPERFMVGGGSGGGTSRFGKKDEAIDFARRLATESNREVDLYDCAKNKLFSVYPDGRVENVRHRPRT